MNILAIGDVVGSIGCEFLKQKLPEIKKQQKIDLTIANGENSADGNGITPFSANFLFNIGVDIITTGNHVFRRKEIFPFFKQNPRLIRPANYPANETPGKGFFVLNTPNFQICIMNLIGTTYLDSYLCPFKTANRIINNNPNSIFVIDFHAEATSEKRALGFYLDGKVSAIFGTHTHVPTADETLLPKGTAYVTDLGMTGPINSCLGVDPQIIIEKFLTKMPRRFVNAQGPCRLDSVVISIDEKTKKATGIKRIFCEL
jgi:metallophosphoesterase (TIGR00282 family)